MTAKITNDVLNLKPMSYQCRCWSCEKPFGKDRFLPDGHNQKWSYRAMQFIHKHPYIFTLFIIILMALFIYAVLRLTGSMERTTWAILDTNNTTIRGTY